MSVAPGPQEVKLACELVDPDIMFPEVRNIQAERRVGKVVCSGCPVQAQCLGSALDSGEHGVWGGMADGDRRAVLSVFKLPSGASSWAEALVRSPKLFAQVLSYRDPQTRPKGVIRQRRR